MATLGSVVSLSDLAKATGPDGSILPVVELLEGQNPVLKSMHWMHGNELTGHTFAYRSGHPSVNWVKIGEGITPSKARQNQMTDTCGIMNARSSVPWTLANLNGMSAQFLASQEVPFVQAMENELEAGLFALDTASAPEKILGLGPRFSATTSAFGGSQTIKANGTQSGSDNTSIWLVCWGPDTVAGIVPKGGTVGFQRIPQSSPVYVTDSGGTNQVLSFVTEWFWTAGLCVMDPRAVAAVRGIDVSLMIADGGTPSTGANLINDMVKAYHKIWQPTRGRCVWYVSKNVGTYLHLQAMNKASTQLTIETAFGRPVTHALGFPVLESTGIVETETTFS
jgi:hypothetical protein